MTVGIAALANGATRIVLMTDKQMTGDYKIEEPTEKTYWLRNGWVAAYAGDRDFAIRTVHRTNAMLGEYEKQKIPWDRIDMGNVCHEAMTAQWRAAVSQIVLAPMFVELDTYRSKDEKTRNEAEAAIKKFRENRTAELLLCGFSTDSRNPGRHIGRLFIIRLDDGPTEEFHFAAIGSGAGVAQSRLTWQKTNKNDPLRRVLYEVYTAKAHAEQMDAYVGKESFAYVLVQNWDLNPTTENDAARVITEDAQAFLDTIFRYYDQTPFKKARRDKEATQPKPPDDWENTLNAFLADVLPTPETVATAAPPPANPTGIVAGSSGT